MVKSIVAGNWKQNTDLEEALHLTQEIQSKLPGQGDDRVILCPPIAFTAYLKKAFPNLQFGAQDCSKYDGGAFTGELSAHMLASIGVKYVILGHSERRAYFGENGADLSTKMNLALKAGLGVILCVGEQLEERKQGRHIEVVKQQLEETVMAFDSLNDVIVAYEPVWAIGTGETASPEQAEEIHAMIRSLLVGKFGNGGEDCTILYGGSVKPSNAKELFAKPNINGGLIGGASLKANDFIQIVNAL